MFTDERNRDRYEMNRTYARDDYARYDYERGYEEERNRTSSAYRHSLESSLERPATRTRLERADEDRYGFYMTAIAADNNYDRFFDNKNQRSEKRVSKRRTPLMVAYIVVALVAIVAVTMAVVGIGEKEIVSATTTLSAESLTATAEGLPSEKAEIAETEEIQEVEAVGGENYILLKSGEVVAIEIPEQTVRTEEKEKGFDKFCSWLNGVFGG